uniref:Uncharacterized protein n=1 Tax=Arundo donax TaxID=35708 RepID=A0A0A8YNC3_ARUDO
MEGVTCPDVVFAEEELPHFSFTAISSLKPRSQTSVIQ